MVHSTVVFFIVVSTILIVAHYVTKIKLDSYTDQPVKLYLIRASIGIVPAFLLASLLFFMFALFVGLK
ncbi:hypothetical protein ACQKKK_08865 [Peribacillus sp. NPDC006672]|uniref:hypothetical protein n=1 Tax=Peribacillus sp. NPDC006672 TaxID=3390606 RepID=UPI003D0622D9